MSRVRKTSGVIAVALIWVISALAGEGTVPLFALPLLLLTGFLAAGRYPGLDWATGGARSPRTAAAAPARTIAAGTDESLPLAIVASPFGRAPPVAA